MEEWGVVVLLRACLLSIRQLRLLLQPEIRNLLNTANTLYAVIMHTHTLPSISEWAALSAEGALHQQLKQPVEFPGFSSLLLDSIQYEQK